MPLSYHHPLDVLRFAVSCAENGKSYAIIVVSHVTGGTMRAQGALMCVSEDGRSAGYISNGCVDADIIFQARESMEAGKPRFLTYGEGSPFRDITLPCGGRIEIWIVPNIAVELVRECSDALTQRRAAKLDFGLDGFSHEYTPKLLLRIAGKGEAVKALVAQALGAGFDVRIQSPEADIANKFPTVSFDHLTDANHPPELSDDPWSAVVLLFHDHDWEPALLSQALNGPAFYIGAMGSARTQKLRRETLLSQGLDPAQVDRIQGPIGLIPSMRDANLLALSALAEIVSAAQAAGRL